MPRSSGDESELSDASTCSSADDSVGCMPRVHSLFSSGSDSDDSKHVERAPSAVPAKDVTYDGHRFLDKIDESSRAEVAGIGKAVWEALEARDKDASSLIEVLMFVLAPLVHYICTNYAVEYKRKTTNALTDNFVLACLMVLVLAGTYGMSPSEWYDEATASPPGALFFSDAPAQKDFVDFMQLVDSFGEVPAGPTERRAYRRPESTNSFCVFLLGYISSTFGNFFHWARDLNQLYLLLGLDDYQFAGRSAKWLEFFGLAKHYNKLKASAHGISLNIIGSNIVRLPIVVEASFADDKELGLSATKKLLQALDAFMYQKSIDPKAVLLDHDRGFGGLRGGLIERGVGFIATLKKRNPKYLKNPVAPSDARQSVKNGAAIVMADSGPAIARFVDCNDTEVCAFRMRGRLTYMQSNVPELYSSWTIKAKDDDDYLYFDVSKFEETVQEAFTRANLAAEELSDLLCLQQRNPVWRTLRKFVFTSTTFIKLLQVDADWLLWNELNGGRHSILAGLVLLTEKDDKGYANFKEGRFEISTPNFKRIRAFLDFCHTLRTKKARKLSAALAPIVGAKLSCASKDELVSALKYLDSKIKQAEIPANLSDLRRLVLERRFSVQPKALYWTLIAESEKAFRGNRATRAGNILEPKVKDVIEVRMAGFTESPCLANVAVMREVGLRESRETPYAASSADGRLLFSSSEEPNDVHVDNLEIKVLSSRKEIDKLEENTKSLGKFVEVDVELGMSENAIKQAIILCQNNPNYLFQCMMHSAVSELGGTCLVFARADGADGALLAVTRLVFDKDVLEELIYAVHVLGSLYMPWVRDVNACDIPSNPYDSVELEHSLRLRFALRELCLNTPITGSVLEFKPSAVIAHNKLKVVADVMRREARPLRVDMNGYGPGANLLAEALSLVAVSAVRAHRAAMVASKYEFEIDAMGDKTAQDLREEMNRIGSTAELLRRAARNFRLPSARDAPVSMTDSEAKRLRHLKATNSKYYRPDDPAWIAEVKRLVEQAKGPNAIAIWNSSRILTAFRSNKSPAFPHEVVPQTRHQRARCVLDCRRCENIVKGTCEVHEGLGLTGVAGRYGPMTIYFCKDCEVFLSMKPRECFGGRSAAQVWHSPELLPQHPYLSKNALIQASPANLPTDSAKKRRRVQLSTDRLSQCDAVFVHALNLNAEKDNE